MRKAKKHNVDNPIHEPKHDLLGRSATAESFARYVLALDASQGLVVGVFGPWGSGKTSFLNFTRAEFETEEIPVLEFNPWLFSGTEQLINRFFAELSEELKVPGRNLKEVGTAFADYGDALRGRKGTALRLAGTYLRRWHGTVANQRERLSTVLKKRDKPIVVVLDDVDRLSTSEIRDIFKLVRLTGSFPNVIYIVACDRLRVEQALEQAIASHGRDYLEKIIQLPFDLPESPIEVLRSQLTVAIEHALSDVAGAEEIDEQVWTDVFPDIVVPLIRNMRDVRRYAASIRESISGLEGQVALVDVLALEAIRVFLPDVFKCLPYIANSLTIASPDRSIHRGMENHIGRFTGAEELQSEQVEEFIAAAGNTNAKHVAQALLLRLFPAYKASDASSEAAEQQCLNESELLRARRVAHESILRLYLERVMDSDLRTFLEAKRACELMTDLGSFNEFMLSIDVNRREAVIRRIGELKDEIRPDHVEVGITGILNLWPELPQKPMDDDALWGIMRVVERLLETLENTGAISRMVRSILPQLTSLSSKWAIVLLVLPEEHSKGSRVSKADADYFRESLGNGIRSARLDDLLKERKPAELLAFARKTPSQYPLDVSQSPKLTYAVLRDSQTQSTSGTMRSRALRFSRNLDWQLLTTIFGNRETLDERVRSLHEQFDEMIPWFEATGISLEDARSLIAIARQREEADMD